MTFWKRFPILVRVQVVVAAIALLTAVGAVIALERLSGQIAEKRSELAGLESYVTALQEHDYTEAVRLRPGESLPYLLRGIEERTTENDPRSAILSLQEATAISPDLFAAHYELALAFRDVRDTANVVAQVKRMYELDPGVRDLFYLDASPDRRSLTVFPGVREALGINLLPARSGG